MEIIDTKNVNQDDYSEAKNKYLELKWKIMFKKYKDNKEKDQLSNEMNELNKKWEFEEIENL